MIVLTASSQSLQALLSASTSTTQLQLTAVYYDDLPQQRSEMQRPRYATFVTTTLNTSPVTVVAAPGSDGIVRNIVNLTGYNADVTSATLAFQIGSTVTTVQKKHTLTTGQSLVYEHGFGWEAL